MRAVLLAFLLLGCIPSTKKVTFEQAFARAEAREKAGNMDEAILNCEIARSLNPSKPEPYLALSRIYRSQGYDERAFEFLALGFENSHDMPPSALDELRDLSTNAAMLIAVAPKGKNSFMAGKGLTDDAKRRRITAALKNRPLEFLLFTEKFVDEGNIKDTFNLLKDFTCPASLRWIYLSIRARGFYLFGREDDLEKIVNEILPLVPQSTDYRRLYEVGRVCLLQGMDEAALALLQRAYDTAPQDDPVMRKKIETALKHPEKVLDEDGRDP